MYIYLFLYNPECVYSYIQPNLNVGLKSNI